MLTVACGATSSPQTTEPEAAPVKHHSKAHHGHAGGHHHDFSDTEKYAARFDAADRRDWQKPEEVVRILSLSPGLHIADIGAGTGYFLSPLSKEVGPTGKVLGLDVEPAMVEHMKKRIEKEAMSNATARACPPDSPGLEQGSVDRILIVNTWHHIGDREAYSRKLRETLRPGGFITVVDFDANSPIGPPASARLSAEAVVEEMRAGGLDAQIVEEALPYQYIVVGR